MNYDEVGISNYFKVTDYKKLDELESKLFCFGNYYSEVYVLKFTDKDGTEWRKYSCYGSLEYGDPEDSDIERFYKELQKILPDNEVFVWHYTGNEGLRYNCSGFSIVTKKDIAYISTDQCISEMVADIAGIGDFDYRKLEGLGDTSYVIGGDK